MICHGSVVNFDVPMQRAKGQDQISMCNCQVPRAQGQPYFTEKPKRCTKNDEIPQKPALLMTRASFYQCFFKTRYRIPFLLTCLAAIASPHIKHRKRNHQKMLKVRNRKGIGIGIQKQGRASRENPQSIEKLNFGMSSNGLDSSQLRFEHVLGRFRVCKQWVFL